MGLEKEVVEHYSRKSLADDILECLDKDADISIDALASYDEFHIGGRAATEYLLPYLDLSKDMKVLDVGCGIGGPARFIAHKTGAFITGIDLTANFIKTADRLTRKVNLADKLNFVCASALKMPCEDRSYERAYMIHVGMNIQDKSALFNEVRRVLKPQGLFVIYDIFGSDESNDFLFPVPWSNTKSTSFLISEEQAVQSLEKSGFDVLHKEDRTEFAIKALDAILEASKNKGSPVMGANFGVKLENIHDNIKSGLCAPSIIVCEAR